MTTQARQEANRRNAQLSTGPRTPEGKAVSSRNAIRHNLSGTTFVLLPSEDRDAFATLDGKYRAEWKPQTEHESFLVSQMVQARWRLNRIARIEAAVYDTIFAMPFAQDHTDEQALVMADSFMTNPMLDKLRRYAKDAERSYNRAVTELRACRAEQRATAKRNEPKSAPARPAVAPQIPITQAATAASYMRAAQTDHRKLTTDNGQLNPCLDTRHSPLAASPSSRW